MRKSEFLYKLDELLEALPKSDTKRSLDYYAEMIDERIENGMSEEEAVAELGAPENIAEQILGEAAPIDAEKAPKRNRRLSVFAIVLLILGSPLWISLLIAAFAIVLSLYVSLWSVIVSLWAVFGALAGTSFGAIVCAVGCFFKGDILAGIAVIGAGIACTGLSILMFCGCKAATNGTILLTKKIALRIKNRSKEKEAE